MPTTLAICHTERKQVQLFANNRAGLCSVSVAETKHFSQPCHSASQRLGSERCWVTLTQQKNVPSVRAVLLCPHPSPWQAQGQAAGTETAQRQCHHPPLSAGRRGWREPVLCLLLPNPAPGVQVELSQARQSYSLIWERLDFLSLLLISLISGSSVSGAKYKGSWCWQGLTEGQPMPLGDVCWLPPLRLWSPVVRNLINIFFKKVKQKKKSLSFSLPLLCLSIYSTTVPSKMKLLSFSRVDYAEKIQFLRNEQFGWNSCKEMLCKSIQ